MLEEATLATNLLAFRSKSFGFERLVEVEGERYALFRRTETESESKLRPKLLEMWVVAPADWIAYDEANDELWFSHAGAAPPALVGEPALEAAAESERFDEQGLAWERRAAGRDRFLYLPAERAGRLASPAALRALGLGAGTSA